MTDVKDKRIAIVGLLKMEQGACAKLVEAAGGVAQASCTETTDICVAGTLDDKEAKVVEAARARGTPIWTEDEFVAATSSDNKDTLYLQYDAAEAVPFVEDALVNAERTFGVKLPASYVREMRAHNGGDPTTCHFSADFLPLTSVWGVPEIVEQNDPQGNWVGEWEYPTSSSEYKRIVYFAEDESAGHILLGMAWKELDDTCEPQIVSVDSEAAGDECAARVIAESFEAFLKMLRKDSYDE